MSGPFVLAIDQGTTSSRALLFDAGLSVVASAQREFVQHFPRPGWVEHEPEDIWQTTLDTVAETLACAGAAPEDIAAIGIANQRETTVIWSRDTGRPVGRAIVWQDRRAAKWCEQLRAQGCEEEVSARSGLLLDPYFSAGKIAWMLSQDDSLRRRAASGELAFGTVDSFLLWRLTGGKAHLTDATNASRTMLYDIRRGEWCGRLLEMFDIPAALLPEARDCACDFGETNLFGGAIKIRGIAGDQQAAAIGQACFAPGMMKSTYGTGCFALLNTGSAAPRSKQRLLTTIAFQLRGKRNYALEGSIFIAGAAVQWLRDKLGILENAAQSGEMAAAADEEQNVILVPAFTGLGAPHWRSDARGAIFGLTRAAGKEELARAALESVCYQTRDLLEAMRADWNAEDAQPESAPVLRVDGGMSASDWTMQFLADILDAPVDRPEVLETTALGAAYLAGLQAGVYPETDEFAERWRLQKRFSPQMPSALRAQKYAGWRDAVARTMSAPGG